MNSLLPWDEHRLGQILHQIQFFLLQQTNVPSVQEIGVSEKSRDLQGRRCLGKKRTPRDMQGVQGRVKGQDKIVYWRGRGLEEMYCSRVKEGKRYG